MSDPAQKFIDGLCGKAECTVCRGRYETLKAAGENLSRLVVLGRARGPLPPDAAHQKIQSTNNNTNQKEDKSVSKKKAFRRLEKEVARQSYPSVSRPATQGVDLSGGQSTIGNPGTASRIVSSFLAGLEDRVRKAQGDLAMAENAGNAMAKEGARVGLRIARRQRLLGKLVVKTSIEANQGPAQFGRAIFEQGSTFNLPDDDSLGFTGRAGEVVR